MAVFIFVAGVFIGLTLLAAAVLSVVSIKGPEPIPSKILWVVSAYIATVWVAVLALVMEMM